MKTGKQGKILVYLFFFFLFYLIDFLLTAPAAVPGGGDCRLELGKNVAFVRSRLIFYVWLDSPRVISMLISFPSRSTPSEILSPGLYV